MNGFGFGYLTSVRAEPLSCSSPRLRPARHPLALAREPWLCLMGGWDSDQCLLLRACIEFNFEMSALVVF